MGRQGRMMAGRRGACAGLRHGLLLLAVVLSTGSVFAAGAPAQADRSAAAPAPAVAPVEFTLANGLRVIVLVDDRAPVLATQVWYGVGSSDEPVGKTGLSHVLEHLMFKGTARVPVGEFSRLVAHFGGDDNAFTSDDQTVYYQDHLADRLALALALEADRMQGLRFDERQFLSELQVVMEERRLRTDDNPQALAYERFKAMAYPSSPSRTPIIGWMRDLERLTLADARDWYQRWYAPNNAVLVVAGAVTVDAVRAEAEKAFGQLRARVLPSRVPVEELPEPGERQLRLSLPGKVPTLYLGFNWPSLSSRVGAADVPALRVLAGVLDEGLSSRLEQRVVRTGKAAAIRSGYDVLARGDTLFTLTAVPGEGQALEAVRDALLGEISLLQNELVSPEEIRRVLANVMASDIFARDRVADQARLYGQLASHGLRLDTPVTYPARLREVTPEQVRDVARRYAVPARMTSVLLTPQAPAASAPEGEQP